MTSKLDPEGLRKEYEEDEGASILELARRHGMSYFPVWKALKKAGTKMRHGAPTTRRRDIKADAVAALYQDGWPKCRIAEALVCSVSVVTRMLKEAGVRERWRRPRSQTKVKCRFCRRYFDPRGVASHEKTKHTDRTLASRIENGEG